MGSTPKRYVTERSGSRRCVSRRMPVDLAAGHHSPGNASHFVGQNDGNDLARLAAEQLTQPLAGRFAAALAGMPDHRGGATYQQRPQPFMARAADRAQALLAAGGMRARG